MLDSKRQKEYGVDARKEDGVVKNLDRFKTQSEAHITADTGLKIADDDNSVKAGDRGAVLLQDFYLRQKITHFDHERIPERVVHARGFGAHGYFQAYKNWSNITRAKFLQDTNAKTPVFIRFSTVLGSRGSSDTVRDARGMAIRFYTEEGNFDMVGNNIPVFFIQDAAKFPDLVHAAKPEQHNDMPQAATAHDSFYDFISQTPESIHMIMWALSDRAIPRSFAMMQGFGVHTFRFIDHNGKGRFVKFHFTPVLGTHSLVWDECVKIAGKDADFHRRDLWEAIEKGAYPEWEFGVQIVEEDDEHKFDFDLLDPTKIIPVEQVPVTPLGKLTLNRNQENFFCETEQIAFCPANVVPGIGFSNDPLLQGRLFSYLDTQLSRLGGPNFPELPINQPLCPVSNNFREGHMRMRINPGPVHYSPNKRGNGCPASAGAAAGYVHYPEAVSGVVTQKKAAKFADHFTQATLFWNSLSQIEKVHEIDAAVFELNKVTDKAIRQRMVDLYQRVHSGFGGAVAAGVGVAVPKEVQQYHDQKSPSLSLVNPENMKGSVKGRKVAFLVQDGFEDHSYSIVRDALEAKHATVEVIAQAESVLTGARGTKVNVDHTYDTSGSVLFDAVYVCGGTASVRPLTQLGVSIHFINEAYKHCKAIACANEGADLVKASNISFINTAQAEGKVVDDRGVLSVRSSADADVRALAEALVTTMGQHRVWARVLGDRVNWERVPA